MTLYTDFKQNLNQLNSSIKLWEATIELCLYKNNQTDWMNSNSADIDGNPIAIFHNYELKKQIRIIQIDQEEGIKHPFSFHLNDFGDSKSFNGVELVISSILNEDNLKKAAQLISIWAKNNIQNEDILREEYSKH